MSSPTAQPAPAAASNPQSANHNLQSAISNPQSNIPHSPDLPLSPEALASQSSRSRLSPQAFSYFVYLVAFADQLLKRWLLEALTPALPSGAITLSTLSQAAQCLKSLSALHRTILFSPGRLTPAQFLPLRAVIARLEPIIGQTIPTPPGLFDSVSSTNPDSPSPNHAATPSARSAFECGSHAAAFPRQPASSANPAAPSSSPSAFPSPISNRKGQLLPLHSPALRAAPGIRAIRAVPACPTLPLDKAFAALARAQAALASSSSSPRSRPSSSAPRSSANPAPAPAQASPGAAQSNQARFAAAMAQLAALRDQSPHLSELLQRFPRLSALLPPPNPQPAPPSAQRQKPKPKPAPLFPSSPGRTLASVYASLFNLTARHPFQPSPSPSPSLSSSSSSPSTIPAPPTHSSLLESAQLLRSALAYLSPRPDSAASSPANLQSSICNPQSLASSYQTAAAFTHG